MFVCRCAGGEFKSARDCLQECWLLCVDVLVVVFRSVGVCLCADF